MGTSLNPASLLSGQGLDVTTLVNQLIGQRSGQLQQWQQQQLTLQLQSGLLTAINTHLNNLATAVSALSDPLGPFTAQTATSSDSGVLSATAQSSASPGVHEIVVGNLARVGTVYSDPLTSGDTSLLGPGSTEGSLHLQVGGSSGSSHDLAIKAGSNDTLNSLATYINAQGWGVTANVITDTTGARLALFSQATGNPGALAITNNTTDLHFSVPSGGTNASLTIDGIPYSSATNTIQGAIPGITLNLAGSSSGNPVALTVGPDTSQAVQALNNFVSAYNQVMQDINQQYAVDPVSHSEGPLGADISLRQLQSNLLADITYSPAGDGYANLASLGIDMNNDGTLTVNSTKLQAALSADPTAVQGFFQNSSRTGFANNLHSDLTTLTDPIEGLLNVDLTQNSAQQKDLSTSINAFEDQLTAQQKQLTNQFSQVSASLQAYPMLLQQVTQTLAVLDPNSNANSR